MAASSVLSSGLAPHSSYPPPLCYGDDDLGDVQGLRLAGTSKLSTIGGGKAQVPRCAPIQQGAEAVLYTAPFLFQCEPTFQASTPSDADAAHAQPIIIKRRFPRAYRHRTLDKKLTRGRLASEARNLLKARKLGVKVPAVLRVDVDALCIYLERIPGDTLKEKLARQTKNDKEQIETTLKALGAACATLHQGNIVHGDLTPSNVMVTTTQESAPSVALIDFGLAQTSTLAEDKAVDLYVLERAINSTANDGDEAEPFGHVLAGYESRASKGLWNAVRTKLDEVRARGRKRTMVG
ncbi:TP53-like kinase [Pseudoscourfieldia marina]